MLDRNAIQPLSRQLAALIAWEIASGQRPAGSRLPSIGELAAEHEIATATVVKAYRILRAEGLIVGVPGHGTFVAEVT